MRVLCATAGRQWRRVPSFYARECHYDSRFGTGHLACSRQRYWSGSSPARELSCLVMTCICDVYCDGYQEIFAAARQVNRGFSMSITDLACSAMHA